MNESAFNLLAGSRASEAAVYLLTNVPGLPPISQAVHILGIAVVMGSVVMVDLRLLGLAVPSQNVSEMIGRLMPWMWCALASNLVTGLLFVFARPGRYFFNPVFGIKFALLVPAVVLAVIVHRLGTREPGYWEASRGRAISARVIAVVSLAMWVGVVLAGRWIAYWDYLFFYE
jgi:hypothetical protein